jgi:hypothetical protein
VKLKARGVDDHMKKTHCSTTWLSSLIQTDGETDQSVFRRTNKNSMNDVLSASHFLFEKWHQTEIASPAVANLPAFVP